MSHITTIKSKVVLKNEQMIKSAITSMAKNFQGMTFEQVSPDVIKMRYAPIEGYQKRGNVQFVKNPASGIWEMQLDYYQCADEITRVREAFMIEYQTTAVSTSMAMQGYTITKKQNGKNMIITAVKY